ncbi:MAG: hypothetical protein KBB37_00945 [Bacteroidia bacterium]|jgi:hypothetical protein|nr:hypothetical protein [Bacteroidia bacterium]MBP7259824.1 hypothetical protein [Bacteroidia bacterium]MBP9723221.1 hypothetical protein [Bacteroidia bacterium]
MKAPAGIFMAFAIFFCSHLNLYACDVCGCSVNANYFGILPQFSRNFAGIRYMSSSYKMRHTPTLFPQTNSKYYESLNRFEVWGRYFFTRRIVGYASVPYQYNVRKEQDHTSSSKGLSDLSILGHFILINTGDSGRFTYRNTLMLGGGIKFPSGRFSNNKPASIQTGTGTWDYSVNMIYTLRYKKVGANADATFRINTSNGDYSYGNRLISSLRFFYWGKAKATSFLLHAGCLSEYSARDRKYGIEQKFTGGNGYYISSGVDAYFRRISAGVSITLPIQEQLNSGFASTRSRSAVQVLYLF